MHPCKSARSCARQFDDCFDFTDLNADAHEKAAHIVDAASLEIGFQFVAERLRYGGIGRQARIGPVVARQHRELHPMGAASLGEVLDAIAPVIQTTEAAHEDEVRLYDGLVDIEIDGERMAQATKRSEAEGRSACRKPMGGRQRSKVTVREGEDDDISRRLLEVCGLPALVEG